MRNLLFIQCLLIYNWYLFVFCCCCCFLTNCYYVLNLVIKKLRKETLNKSYGKRNNGYICMSVVKLHVQLYQVVRKPTTTLQIHLPEVFTQKRAIWADGRLTVLSIRKSLVFVIHLHLQNVKIYTNSHLYSIQMRFPFSFINVRKFLL